MEAIVSNPSGGMGQRTERCRESGPIQPSIKNTFRKAVLEIEQGLRSRSPVLVVVAEEVDL